MTAQVLEDMLSGGENSEFISLKYAPEKLKTVDQCLKAVEQYGLLFKYVPEELKTAKMCLMAVRWRGWALQYVPEKLKEQVKKAAGKERPDITLYDFVGKDENDLFINTRELADG